jgi:lysophospholipase L1-like esterase
MGPFTLSCANAPSSSLIADYVLGPDDVAALNAQLVAMNAIIAGEAAARGFAYFPLSALYEDANVKAPFNAVTLMTSTQPYGPLISLDGLHPTPAGSAVLAAAAARALNATYHFGIPTSGATADLVASLARR